MSQRLANFHGTTLYLDTMIPYALLRALEPEAQTLFARIQSGEFMAYTSVLTYDEVAYRLLLALIKDHYGGSPLDKLRHNEEDMLTQFYPRLMSSLDQLRTFPNLSWVDATVSDLTVMNEVMLNYHLRPRDALHLATMRKCACFDLVSHDADFDRVSEIQRYTLK